MALASSDSNIFCKVMPEQMPRQASHSNHIPTRVQIRLRPDEATAYMLLCSFPRAQLLIQPPPAQKGWQSPHSHPPAK
eukprot:CAMPEP_0119405866 /NCGR_PEP_ID=MMETSP1335-20130426/415_1 /TAXON_ID=259385 /ORGANISM="Chrysoculter rhomboideus, Strain RCC1486" /LENGTH=77 /DNA_ID=CAMNT_0007429913 /DNA_START=49 /DNA_END=282 /DNA_ORIENTATION=+